MHKISVIIPVYGVEKYIERCARSLFEQTLDDIEFIFVDDCTPDRSMEILSQIIEEYRLRFAEKNYVVRIERMPTNSGQAAVRRHGLQLCTGDYIIHCDSDDWVEPDMFTVMYKTAKKENADVVICDYFIASDNNNKRPVKGCRNFDADSLILDLIYQRTSWAVWNKLVKSELYKGVEVYPECAMGEDMVMTTQLYCNSSKFAYIDEALYNYFFNSSSIMNAHSREKCLDKYRQLKINTDLILPILRKKFNHKTYTKFSNCLCYNMTIPLFPYLYEWEVWKIWLNEMISCSGLLLDSNVKKIFKIMYMLILTGIYPLYKKIRL